jgi:hypothetical protein
MGIGTLSLTLRNDTNYKSLLTGQNAEDSTLHVTRFEVSERLWILHSE